MPSNSLSPSNTWNCETFRLFYGRTVYKVSLYLLTMESCPISGKKTVLKLDLQWVFSRRSQQIVCSWTLCHSHWVVPVMKDLILKINHKRKYFIKRSVICNIFRISTKNMFVCSDDELRLFPVVPPTNRDVYFGNKS